MALEFRKEKNIIYLVDEEKNYHYHVDINSGLIYNEKTNKSLKRLPFSQSEYSTVIDKFYKAEDYYNAYFVYLFREYKVQYLRLKLKIVDKYLNFLKTLDIELTSYFTLLINEIENMEKILKHAKMVKEILICEPDLCYYPREIIEKIEKAENCYWKEMKDDKDFTNDERDYLWFLIVNSSLIKQELCFYYGYKQKYIKILTRLDFRDLIDDYINNCKQLGKEPIKTSNGMREFIETSLTAQRLKNEYNQKKWIEIYTKLAPKVLFEYGNYMIVLPEKPNDLIVEGELMHHCVGSYVDKVVKEQTYIVFVRKKNNPKTPYITAQIKLNGSLGQYFLAYDQKIKSSDDIEFKNAYQNHLNEVWDE